MGSAATEAAIDALILRVRNATRDVCADAADMFQRAARDKAPIGKPPNSTNAPGDLRDSMKVTGPYPEGADTWRAEIGPTVIYARQRELGGRIWGRPWLYFYSTEHGHKIRKHTVFQVGAHYMLAAYAETLPKIPPAATARIAAALIG